MRLEDYQHWLCGDQWNGYPLADILQDSAPLVNNAELRVFHLIELGFAKVLKAIRALRSLSILNSGLCGEAGEASEHFKKWMRDGVLNKREAGIELGDNLAYLTWLAKTLGYTLEDIAQLNYEKLTTRGKPTAR